VLNKQIKDAIGFKGFIMSDWKAVYGWDFARYELLRPTAAPHHYRACAGDRAAEAVPES
jgi:beta-glucosidase-like glycosyl hydrolase